jgi:2,4-dienoyl-CoA reductase-like NADH-dependent reductase (Old Yellow Enzyme family)
MQRPWFGNGPLDQADFNRGDMPWTPIGPSALPIIEGWPVPHELSETEIYALIDDYASAAWRAVAAGYKVAEIHGVHGYLIHSFLFPISNQRSDRYGGDLSGRMRLALEVAQIARATWPSDLPLFFRTSAVDGLPEGWSLDDTIVLAQELKQIRVDVIDCSFGGITVAAMANGGQKRQPGFQVGYAERVHNEADIMTMAVGLITHP